MQMKKFCYTAAVALILGLATTVAWAAIVPPGVKLAAKQELVRTIGSEPESLDPALITSLPAATVGLDLFEGLTTTNSFGDVVPGVATSWKQIKPDVWVFQLRHDDKWSNGKPVTAQDFVYSWRRFLDPKTASQYASTYAGFLVNGLDITNGKKAPSTLGVKALGKYTIQVETTTALPFVPALLANTPFAPVPKEIVEKYGSSWTKPGHMVSNGAFELKAWQVNDHIEVKKNPYYWDAKDVQLTKITYLPTSNESTDVSMFQAGQTNWTLSLPPGTFAKYKKQYPKDIRSEPYLAIGYYDLNNNDPLLKDVRVRQALSMVVDRNILVDKVIASGFKPLYGMIPEGLSGAQPFMPAWASWPMSKRVTEAKKLLAEAGVKPGTTLTISYNTADINRLVSLFLAAEWGKIGFNVKAQSMEFKVLLNQRYAGQFQVARDAWQADYNDATNFLALIGCGDGQNSSQYCNPKVDALIAKGNQSTDPIQRTKLMTEADDLAMNDYPVVPLFQQCAVRLVNSWVGGYGNNPLDVYHGRDLYIIAH